MYLSEVICLGYLHIIYILFFSEYLYNKIHWETLFRSVLIRSWTTKRTLESIVRSSKTRYLPLTHLLAYFLFSVVLNLALGFCRLLETKIPTMKGLLANCFVRVPFNKHFGVLGWLTWWKYIMHLCLYHSEMCVLLLLPQVLAMQKKYQFSMAWKIVANAKLHHTAKSVPWKFFKSYP